MTHDNGVVAQIGILILSQSAHAGQRKDRDEKESKELLHFGVPPIDF